MAKLEKAIRRAYSKDGLHEARALVNGGTNGVKEFIAAIHAGRLYLHLNVAAPIAKKAAKTTR